MKTVAFAAFVATLSAAPAMAQVPAGNTTNTVTNINGDPRNVGVEWGQIPNETRGDNASVSLQGDVSRDGDGSVMLTGDRTRLQTGVQYLGGTSTGLKVSDMQSLTFDYMVANGGNRGIQSPALRLFVQDGDTRSELIWEAAYNDANGSAVGFYDLDTWYTSSSTALFWRYVAGPIAGSSDDGYTGTGGLNSGSYVLNTISGWASSSLFGSNAVVTGTSIGNGSGAGGSFVGYADNVVGTSRYGSQTTNFAAVAAVPEPGTWAMMLIGFGAMGVSMRRNRRRVMLQAA